MIIAILGMLLIVKPEFSSSVIPSIAGLFSGIFAASAYTCVRALSTWKTLYNCILFLIILSCCLNTILNFHIWTYDNCQVLYLLGAGLSAAVGQIGITLAYSFAPAKDISIFTYASIIFTALFGFILFGETPDMLATLGYVVIISASYYMFEKARRESNIKES